MERYTTEELRRFNSRWLKVGECHRWQGYLDKDGYGTFFFRRLGRRAHRVSYYLFKGDIPKDMVVDHLCSVRNCVNPEHLRIVTAIENTKAAHAAKVLCKRGHPFDRKYGKQRYCSICASEKSRRLRAKWKAEDTVMC